MPYLTESKPKSSSREGKVVLRSCPKCKGARRIERDPYGWYVMCFNCGFTTYPSIHGGSSAGADRKSA